MDAIQPRSSETADTDGSVIQLAPQLIGHDNATGGAGLPSWHKAANLRVLLAAPRRECTSLRRLLRTDGRVHILGEVGESSLLILADSMRPQVVILDLGAFDDSRTAFTLCRRLVTRQAGIGILVLAHRLDERLPIAAARAGARGYLMKDVDGQSLVRAVWALSRGEHVFDSRIMSGLVSELTSSDPDALTPRECAVLKLMAAGLSNPAIGQQLFISESTVKFHVSNMIRKLNTKSRAGAVYEGAKLGLI